MSSVPIDGDAVDLIARERKGLHEGEGNHRPAFATDSMTAERVGAAAEAAFSLRYSLPSPNADRVHGDDGYDYCVMIDDEPTRVEIKGSEHDDPSLMLSDEYRGGADAYVVASVSWPERVWFVGWLDAEQLEERGRREDSKFGGRMTVVDGDDLDPMPPVEAVERYDD